MPLPTPIPWCDNEDISDLVYAVVDIPHIDAIFSWNVRNKLGFRLMISDNDNVHWASGNKISTENICGFALRNTSYKLLNNVIMNFSGVFLVYSPLCSWKWFWWILTWYKNLYDRSLLGCFLYINLSRKNIFDSNVNFIKVLGYTYRICFLFKLKLFDTLFKTIRFDNVVIL